MTPWWSAYPGNLFGAYGGAALGILAGILGSLAGLLAPRGKAKSLIYTGFLSLAFIGLCALLAGLVALALKQPWHVWYPLVLCGGIITLVIPMQFPAIRNRYRQAEQRRLQAEELRRS
jgi:MFS family permease